MHKDFKTGAHIPGHWGSECQQQIVHPCSVMRKTLCFFKSLDSFERTFHQLRDTGNEICSEEPGEKLNPGLVVETYSSTRRNIIYLDFTYCKGGLTLAPEINDSDLPSFPFPLYPHLFYRNYENGSGSEKIVAGRDFNKSVLLNCRTN